MKKSLILLLVLLLQFMPNAISYAQEGQIMGKVLDSESKEALPGANVMLTGLVFEGIEIDIATPVGAATDLEGKYRILGVAEGEYIMEIRYIGYESKKVNVMVEAGKLTQMNIELAYKSIAGEEVKVTAQAEAQMQAINQQITSKTITNVVSSKKIQALPEANAAEAVGRLPGISLERSGGEGTKVMIRGMGAKYTKVQIDGVNLTATGEGDRSSDLSMISPYMLQGIELTKSIMANQEATATGGIVNFMIKKAPERPSFNVIVQGGSNSLRSTYDDYKVSIGGSKRFMANLLGVYAQLDFEQKDAGSQQMGSVNFSAERKQNVNGDDTTYYEEVKTNSMQLKDIFRKVERLGGALVIDYTLPNTEIKSSNFVSRIKKEEQHFNNTYTYDQNNFGTGFSDTPERWLTVLTNSLKIDHRWQDWEFNLGFSHSYSENILPASISSGIGGSAEKPFGPPEGINRSSDYNIDLDPESIPDSMTNYYTLDEAVANSYFATVSHDENEIFERDLAGEFNVVNNFKITDQIKVKLSMGGKIRHKTKSYDRTNLMAENQGANQEFRNFVFDLFEDQFSQETIDAWNESNMRIRATDFWDKDYSGTDFFEGRYDFGNIANIDMYREIHEKYIENADNIGTDIYAPVVSNYINTHYNDYHGTEDYHAFYIMPEISITSKIMLIPGVRYEANQTEYTGYRGNRLGVLLSQQYSPIDTVTKTRENDFILPMIQAFYNPVNWLTLKAGYTKTLQRPNYDNIKPGYVIGNQGNISNLGNFRLKPEQSTNLDLQMSIFSDKVGLFSFGIFHKKITDMIFWTGTTVVLDTAFFELPSSMFRKRVAYAKNNEKDAYNYGYEIEWQSNFWYLPGLLSGLVMNINYTRNESEAKYLKSFIKTRLLPDWTNEQYSVDTTYSNPMLNQPDHLLNLTLGYDYKGFSFRSAMRYKSKIFTSNNWYESLLGYSRTFIRFDLSFKQKLPVDGLEAFLNINNITNEYEISEINHLNFVNYRESYGRSASLGFRYIY